MIGCWVLGAGCEWVSGCALAETACCTGEICAACVPRRHGRCCAAPPAGDVRVNWRPCTKSSADVKAGDLISVAGKGRLEVQTVDMTGKGKYRVQMRRFV